MLLIGAATSASPCWADNCSGLSDCFFTLAAALVVVALLALLIAFLLSSGGTGAFALAGFGSMGSSAAGLAAWWTNLAAAAAAASAAAAAAGTVVQMSSNGTPGNNEAQNKQFRDAVREAEHKLGRKLDKSETRRVHDEITGENMGFHEIVQTILAMFGG